MVEIPMVSDRVRKHFVNRQQSVTGNSYDQKWCRREQMKR